jgi:hypothetical protein
LIDESEGEDSGGAEECVHGAESGGAGSSVGGVVLGDQGDDEEPAAIGAAHVSRHFYVDVQNPEESNYDRGEQHIAIDPGFRAEVQTSNDNNIQQFLSLSELIPAKKRKRQQPLLDFTQSIILTSKDYSKGLEEILAKKEATAAAALKRRRRRRPQGSSARHRKISSKRRKRSGRKQELKQKKKELEALARRSVPAARARRGRGGSAVAVAEVQVPQCIHPAPGRGAQSSSVEGWGGEGSNTAATGQRGVEQSASAAENLWRGGWRQGEAGFYEAQMNSAEMFHGDLQVRSELLGPLRPAPIRGTLQHPPMQRYSQLHYTPAMPHPRTLEVAGASN